MCSIIFLNNSVGQELTKQRVNDNESVISRNSIQNISDVKISPKELNNKSPCFTTSENGNYQDSEKNTLNNPIQKLESDLKVLEENLRLAKSNDGKEYFEDGRLKLAVNISMIESYFRLCQSKDTFISWIDLLKSWEIESIRDLYVSYINFDVNKSSLLELNNYLAKQYKERQDTTIRITPADQNYITNVEFDDQ